MTDRLARLFDAIMAPVEAEHTDRLECAEADAWTPKPREFYDTTVNEAYAKVCAYIASCPASDSQVEALLALDEIGGQLESDYYDSIEDYDD